jgi:uncharacterized protein YcnI
MRHQPRATRRRAARVAVRTLAGTAAGVVLLVAAPGWAHVEIEPEEATQGGETALSFRVANESEAASTVKVQVYLPTDHPLASVSVRPHPGWHTELKPLKLDQPVSTDDGEVTETVSRVTWVADSPRDALEPGEYDEFAISVGPLPEVSSLVFKTLQTYSDGTVVRWIDPPAAEGEPEPEHPAPTLTLLPVSDSSTTGTAGGESESDGDGGSTAALVLSVVAVVLAAGALGVSLLRRRT